MGELIVMRSGTSGPVLPYFDVRVPAGFPSPADDYLERSLDLGEHLGVGRAATFLMTCEGESMMGVGILDGDLLVVDRAAPVASGSVVVAAVNGQYMVKRLRRDGGRVWLESANPRFKAIEVSGEADLHIFGVVRHAIHTL